MFCLPATKRCVFLTICLEARCTFTDLGHLGAPHRNGASGGGGSWLLPLGPSPPTPSSILQYQGPCTPMWTLQPTSPNSGYPCHPEWSPHGCPSGLGPYQGCSLPSRGQTPMGLETFNRHLLGPRLWSRRRSIGSGWSLLFGLWGETQMEVRSFKVRAPRQSSYPACHPPRSKCGTGIRSLT